MGGGSVLKIKLFTDSDLDGLGCSIVAKMAFGENAEVVHCTHRNLNQRVDDFLHNEFNHQYALFITDMAVNPELEKRLDEYHRQGASVQLIDHHVTSLHFNAYAWAYVETQYPDGRKTCATSLFYEHFVKEGWLRPTRSLEDFVDLVRQYDTWEWEETNTIMAKQLNDLFFMFGREQFEEDVLKRLRDNSESFELTDFENLLMGVEEKKIERYINTKNKQIVQRQMGEYCIGIVHAEQYLSELGNALNKRNPHLDMVVLVNMGSKKVGFRTIHEHVNVAEFAKIFGGGGHPKASGCELTDEAFKMFVLDVFHIPPLKPDPEKNEINVKDSPGGTFYENHQGEVFCIIKNENHRYRILQDGKMKEEQEFPTFAEAERFVKRKFAAWLQYDRDLNKH